MRTNLETIVDASRNAGARVLLVGMRLPPNYGVAYTKSSRKYSARRPRAARCRWYRSCSRFAEKRTYFLPDTVHPAAEAQPIILETVWKGLRPLLKK
jgi:acyl-CoA thioesterase-1